MKRAALSRSVLVLGDDTLSFLASVRSLGRAGLAVDVGWVRFGAPASRSRFIRHVIRLPEIGAAPSLWLAALNAEMDRASYDMVLPCYDSHAIVLQANRRSLVHPERYVLLPEEAYAVCASKKRTHDLAAALDIPVPRQRAARSTAEVLEAADELGYPLVAKPETSVTADDPASRRRVTKLFDREAAVRFASAGLPAEGILLEEDLPGRGGGVEFLARQGELAVVFQHERLHEPLLGGWSSYRRSVAVEPALRRCVSRLVEALAYTGPGMAEFKLDPATGRFALLELNGRLWGSLPLTVAAGCDMPRHLYELWCLGQTEFPTSYRAGVYARNWSLDRRWLGTNARADRQDPRLMTVPLRRVAGEIRNLLLLRERSDTFAWDDRRPALAEAKEILAEVAGPVLSRLPFRRSLLRRRAEAELRRARSVLFVCLGNICRSPFAELAASGWQGTVCSAGTLDRAGRESPRAAVAAARRFGIDLAGHRSRTLRREMIVEADVIFVFDREQERELRARFPESDGKVHFLGALAPRSPLEIEDPYGRGEDDFVEVYRRIHLLVRSRAWSRARSA